MEDSRAAAIDLGTQGSPRTRKFPRRRLTEVERRRPRVER